MGRRAPGRHEPEVRPSSSRRLRRCTSGSSTIASACCAGRGAGWWRWPSSPRSPWWRAASPGTSSGARDAAAAEAQHQRDAAQAAQFASETGRLAALAPTLTTHDPSLSFLLAVEAARRKAGPGDVGRAARGAGGRRQLARGALQREAAPRRRLRRRRPDRGREQGGRHDLERDEPPPHRHPVTLPVPAHGPRYETEQYAPISVGGGRVAWVGSDGVRLRDGPAQGRRASGRRARCRQRRADPRRIRRRRGELPSGRSAPCGSPTSACCGCPPATVPTTSARPRLTFGLAPPPPVIENNLVPTVLALAPDGRTLVVVRVWQARTVDLISGEPMSSAILPFGGGDLSFEPTTPIAWSCSASTRCTR